MIFLYSYHHGNTKQIANVIAYKINAQLMEIDKMKAEKFDFSALEEYQMIGFGSGIDSGRHYKEILDFSNKLPVFKNKKKTFIFSTSAIYSEKKMLKDHSALREILQNKGLEVVGEFSCLGHNTNSFLKFFGGMNKGRPNVEDLKKAEVFAGELLLKQHQFNM